MYKAPIDSPQAMKQEPPIDPPHDCERDGHEWKFLGSVDGYDFYRCLHCGEESEG